MVYNSSETDNEKEQVNTLTRKINTFHFMSNTFETKTSIFNSMKIQESIRTYFWKVETQTTFRLEYEEKKKGYKSRFVLPTFLSKKQRR